MRAIHVTICNSFITLNDDVKEDLRHADSKDDLFDLVLKAKVKSLRPSRNPL